MSSRAAPRLQQPQFFFALALAVSIVAFWPQLYSQLTTIDAAHLIHGLTATAWMGVPVIQSWLAARGRIGAHRTLGRLWLLFAPIVVLGGLHMVQLMIRAYEKKPDPLLMKFAVLDVAGSALFVAFLVLAVRSIRRRDVEAHLRFMTCTILVGMEPAIERVFVFYIPRTPGFNDEFYPSLIVMEAIVLTLLIVDWRRARPLSLAYATTLAFFTSVHLLAAPLAESITCQRVAIWFASI
jgi:uncharacterized membrane protein YozB (DUF420 family)